MSEPATDLAVRLQPIVRLVDDHLVGQQVHVGTATPLLRVRLSLRVAGVRAPTAAGRLHVDVEPDDLTTPLFPTTVAAAVGRAGCRSLVLEVRADAPVRDSPVLRQNLEQLRSLGVRLAVADFDGGADIERLRLLRPEVIKVHLARVFGSGARPGLERWVLEAAARTRAVLVLEGIADDAQRQHALAAGFTYGQGPRWR